MYSSLFYRSLDKNLLASCRNWFYFIRSSKGRNNVLSTVRTRKKPYHARENCMHICNLAVIHMSSNMTDNSSFKSKHHVVLSLQDRLPLHSRINHIQLTSRIWFRNPKHKLCFLYPFPLPKQKMFYFFSFFASDFQEKSKTTISICVSDILNCRLCNGSKLDSTLI